MRETLADIRQKLRDVLYQNEEHVRLSLVARVLQSIGWNIWDPTEVHSEFRAVPTEDGTKVDFALFCVPRIPAAYIEVKAVGKLQDLGDAERQLRDYNRNNTASFSILTDGRSWRFYYSQTGGEFRDKCFKKLDLQADAIEDSEEILLTFLGRDSIRSGNANREAEAILVQSQTDRVLEDCLPAARRMITEPPYPALPDALVTLASQRGMAVSREKAESFLAGRREPLATPPPTEEKRQSESKGAADGVVLVDPDRPENLAFADVLQAKFGSQPASKWNDLVREGLIAAKAAGITFAEVQRLLTVRIVEGNRTVNGYRPIGNTGWSAPGMDANRCWNNALSLAKRLRTHVEVRLRWGLKASTYPDREGVIRWMPAR